MPKPQILKIQTLARTRLFHIQAVDLLFANGAQVTYERIKGGSTGGVLIVPLLDEETVLLIREYAVGVERYELALPKGRVEPGEDLLQAANRELMEEVGYAARSLRHITSLTVAPTSLSHASHVILAQDLYPQRAPGDEPEEIEVVPWRLADLPALCAQAECTEARSIAALFLVQNILQTARA